MTVIGHRGKQLFIALLAFATPSIGIYSAPEAVAVPAPEVEYLYNVTVRRHFEFPNNDALGYGWGICDKVSRGMLYRDVMHDVLPDDEQASNYVVSYAVGILCPAQIWQVRQSAAGHRPPA